MSFPIKTCAVCDDEFELMPDKPGFANRCPACSIPDADPDTASRPQDADERRNAAEVNDARKKAMRDLLYRKDA